MIEVEITDDILRLAHDKAIEMGKLNNSITDGEGNLAGFVGEFVANSVLGGVVSNTYDYDIRCGDLTYDVKTKRCTSKPQQFYECSVAAFNVRQLCDRYVFVRVQLERRLAWVVGWEAKDSYFEKAVRLNKGDIDPSNNFTVKATCFNLPISELQQFGATE